MAKATQYEFETLCRAILDAVGGSQNIANVFHCSGSCLSTVIWWTWPN